MRILARAALFLGMVGAVVVSTASLASAHTEVRAETAADGRTRVSLWPEQECGKAALPTTGLRIQVPEGASDVQAQPDERWAIEATPTEVAWTSSTGSAEPTFVVEMALTQPAGSTIYLKAIQLCPNGEEIAWIQVPSSNGETLQRPAPSFVVPANSTSPTTSAVPATTASTSLPATTSTTIAATATGSDPGGDDGSPVVIIVVVLVVIVAGGGGVLVWRSRRGGGTS